ncbi:MAG: bifunctional methylenetetrahydrofolate dehydrogenase/methenyltetrahydrofolate cyclohydrolase FolD [Deferribacteraceae bacterium]|jgi:methylenetetrahydrofolate dehydrogenase (NADP+)/methenyltetrahydrofolate cyclohydrolase|nr:bifunctional methylenetetrahydrofolate dehydrogenase/methenyltetrahydrofolate cyclohydrolase FolD [Deferribacteraceae bacterium]
MAILLDGFSLAQKVRSELKDKIASLNSTPSLAVILVGDDPASQVYVGGKEKAAAEVGINSIVKHLSKNISEGELLNEIKLLNEAQSVDGILVQLPLPDGIDVHKIISAIDPKKDVDGFHPINAGLLSIGKPSLIPCTPKGIMRLLSEYSLEISGKNAVVIGRSNIVGKPISQLLLAANATVTVCHSKTANLSQAAKNADILIAAIGRPRYVKAEFIKEGAVVVDVGMNRLEGKLCGDVDFESVSPLASAITPVPKGVGPMTIAMLLENTCEAHVSRKTIWS